MQSSPAEEADEADDARQIHIDVKPRHQHRHPTYVMAFGILEPKFGEQVPGKHHPA